MSETPDLGGTGDTPPYLSGTTFYNFIDAHRHAQPTRIDRSIMGSIAGGDQVRILKALRFFNLISEDGTPTSVFSSLRDIEGEELAIAWQTLLRNAYPYLFSEFNLEKATQGQIEERFREQGIKGDTVRKAVTFFTTLALKAGLTLSPYFKSTRQRAPRGPRTVRKTARPRATQREPDTTAPESLEPVTWAAPRDPVLFHPAIDAYLRAARKIIEGDEWDKAARDRVVTGFETQLDLFLPIKK